MRVASPGLLAILLLCAAPPAAVAEVQNGGALVSIASTGVRVPACIVAQPDSGALVVFEDTYNASADLWAQRLDRHGRPTLGREGVRVWSAPFGATLGGFSPDGSGGVVFTFSVNGGASGQDVMVQRVLSTGTLAYALPGLVVCNATGDQTNPNITLGPSGSYWVEWTDGRALVVNQADLYVQRLTLAGAPQLAANGIPVNTAAYRTTTYGYASVASEPAGGLLLAWNVASPGGMRAQRVNSAGTLLFGATGAALGAPSDYGPVIAPDGSGGMWACTSRYDGSQYTPYAHHLTAGGTSSFAPTGIAFHAPNTGNFSLYPVRDASNGLFVYGLAWNNSSTTGSPLFRQQVDSGGNLLRGTNGDNYGYDANMMSLFDTGTGVVTVVQEFPNINGWQNRVQRWGYDGTGAFPGSGVVVGRLAPNYGQTAFTACGTAGNLVMEAQADPRYNTPADTYNYQAFGQALDAAGNPLWDDAENPVLASVKDAPADQGGFVRAAWSAGTGDDPAARAVVGYRGWRSLELTAAAALAARHPAVTGAFAEGSRHYLSLSGQYWEEVADLPAAQLAGYALTLPTGQDSTGAGAADEAFMIEAYDDSLHHWWSAALDAHSVDNLAPAVPAPFTGQYTPSATYLQWNPDTEPDLAGYRLYRGSSMGFVPSPANRIAAPTSPNWTDPGGVPYVYKLSAVDVHGNESGFATVVPTGALAVDGTPRSLAFALASTNPSHGDVALRLALPDAAHVRVAIYDAAGREVRALADRDQPAGTLALAWAGDDDAGRLAPSGLYFARLVTAGRVLTVRLALAR